MEIQEYLNTHYPNKRETTRLVLANKSLTGELVDLSDFPNLKDIELSDNQVSGRLEIFSGLSKLKDLRIRGNGFSGSLFDLRNLPLKYLDIDGNEKIDGDMDVLPATLKTFKCRKVIFARVMKHFDYDLEAWRLYSRPKLLAEQE
jgi:hypothetical protein